MIIIAPHRDRDGDESTQTGNPQGQVALLSLQVGNPGTLDTRLGKEFVRWSFVEFEVPPRCPGTGQIFPILAKDVAAHDHLGVPES